LRDGAARRGPVQRSARPAQRSPPAEAGQHLLDFSRIEAGRKTCRPSTSRPTCRAPGHRGAGQRLPLRRRAGRAAAGRGLPAPARTGLRGPGDVGEDRPEPALQRLQVHLRGRDRGAAAPRRRARGELIGRGHRHRHRGRRAAAHLRALSPREGRALAYPRGDGHRPCPGPGAGQAARRRRSGGERGGRGTTFTVRIPTGDGTPPPRADRGPKGASPPRPPGRPPSWRRRLRWLPDQTAGKAWKRRFPRPAPGGDPLPSASRGRRSPGRRQRRHARLPGPHPGRTLRCQRGGRRPPRPLRRP
jgi:hypothetical protein